MKRTNDKKPKLEKIEIEGPSYLVIRGQARVLQNRSLPLVDGWFPFLHTQREQKMTGR